MAKLIVQSKGFDRYYSLLEAAIEAVDGDVSNLKGAFAYATFEGVRVATETLSHTLGDDWEVVTKRWLIGIDWFRSKPQALTALRNLPRSSVKVPSGRELIDAGDCAPAVPYHSKTLIVRGVRRASVLFGSGNLSRSGLTRGCEVGGLLIFGAGRGAVGRLNDRRLTRIEKWFDREWRIATPFGNIAADYSALYREERRLRNPTPTDDDQAADVVVGSTGRRRVLSAELLQKLRVCDHLWIEAGNLHANRGPGRPGNQLMMSPMSRVFFGFPAVEVDRDTLVGHVLIQFERNLPRDHSLRYSNNAMDVLSLPIPETEGPTSYDQEVLHFQRLVVGSNQKFVLRLGNGQEVRKWRQASERILGAITMTSGRRWGVY